MERRGLASSDLHIQVVTRAIQQRKLLNVSDGEGGRTNVRAFEPHILFQTKDGNVVLGGYQVNDSTRAGKPPVWHNIPVNKIGKVAASKERFIVRSGFNPNDQTKYYTVIVAAATP